LPDLLKISTKTKIKAVNLPYKTCSMLLRKIAIFLLLFLIFSACTKAAKKGTDEQKDDTEIQKKTDGTISTDGKDIKLKVSAKMAILRSAPDAASLEITRLKEGDFLDYLNILTTFTTPLIIQGIEYDEPWLKAKTKSGKEGWIYAGNISFEGLSDKKLAEMVFDRRLYKVFGNDLTKDLKYYQREMEDLRTLPAFRMLYRRSEDLRKSMDKVINEKLALAPKDSLPDFFWLNEAFPGFMVHLVNKNKSYKLFRDFKVWQSLAKESEEKTDDLFISVYLLAYRSDSIEFTHADWRLELDDEQYSLLGRGIHKEILDAIEKALIESDDFKPELEPLKSKILDDISFSKDFWESKDAALKELEKILKTDYKILKKTERVELASVKNKLKDPLKYGIKTSLFDGGE
jgi:hypothetical protein